MSDYGGFGAIVKEAQKLAEMERVKPEVACPLCGSPLQFARGLANCPMGHYRTQAVQHGAR